VQHSADTGNRKVQLEVALVVPGERSHPVALLHAQRTQPPRETIDAIRKLGVLRALDYPLAPQRDQLGAAIARADPVEDVMQSQREFVLHEPPQHLRHPLLAPSLGASSASSS